MSTKNKIMKKLHVPYNQKTKLFIIDANFISNHSIYSTLFDDRRFTVSFATSIKQIFEREFLIRDADLLIMNPNMPSYGYYEVEGEDHSLGNKLLGQRYYRDRLQERSDLIVFVWGPDVESALEHWGDNVKRRLIIPPGTEFSFLPHVEKCISWSFKLFHKKTCLFLRQVFLKYIF